MKDDIKICVNARVNFFSQYVTVPNHLKGQLAKFIDDINALGESCTDAADFEAKFSADSLMTTFNNLVAGCTPIPREMTDEEKAYVKQVKKEMAPSKKEIAKIIAEDVENTVMIETKSALRGHRRELMNEAGVLDDFTIASNVVDKAKSIFSKFKKK